MSQKKFTIPSRTGFVINIGVKSGNISLDLRIEHMNKIVKTVWKALGYNINTTLLDPVELIIDTVIVTRKLHQ